MNGPQLRSVSMQSMKKGPEVRGLFSFLGLMQSARTLANKGQPLTLDFSVWFDHISFIVRDLSRATVQVDEAIDLA